MNAVPLHAPFEQIEREIADRESRRFGLVGGAPDERIDAREEFGKGERLGEIIIAADFETLDPVIHGPLGRKRDDGRLDFFPPDILDYF